MKNPLAFSFLLFLLFGRGFSQEQRYLAFIPDNLKENANACIRESNIVITIASQKSMNIKTKRVVTVFNEYGLRHMRAGEAQKVKNIEAIIYNAFGKEIKKIKRKDFKEVSASDGSITDAKILYLDYTPTEYPFTMVYTSEVETYNTAFIPKWSLLDSKSVSIEKTAISVNCLDATIGFKYKENNFGEYQIRKTTTPNTVTFSAENIPAFRDEDYSPAFLKSVPHVLFGVNNFYLEGVSGKADTWEEFGSWMKSNLLEGTDEIPEVTKSKIKALIGNETNPLEIAKIVYKYVQGKTRYVSIQLGIGGWKPMLAKDVDRLGYGDCKALTNYTRALLKTVGVTSYYTVIHADDEKFGIDPDFVSMQGNHVILGLPVADTMIWLECTSQLSPFGFQSDFTDDRTALMIGPEGGKIIKTPKFSTIQNSQFSSGNYTLAFDGSISGKVSIKSRGTQYGNKYGMQRKSNEDVHKSYKQYFSHINNLKITQIEFSNNTDEIEFIESVGIYAEEYANKSGGKLLFSINAFNQFRNVPQRYRNRINPFQIQRGFFNEDEIIVTLPDGFKIEAQPNDFELKDIYGHYKTEYKIIDHNQILYKRTLQINEGEYSNSEYENYRKFSEQIAKNDNAKIVLAKN